VIEDPSLLPTASQRVNTLSPCSGIVADLDALAIGRAANLLGAGRFVKEDTVDYAVGIELLGKIGDPTTKGEPLAILHVNDTTNLDRARAMVEEAYTIGEGPVTPPPLIIERISED
jgi:thymidine phosphorylase